MLACFAVACAGENDGARNIIEAPSQIVMNATVTPEMEAALDQAGWTDRLDIVRAGLDETTWPAPLVSALEATVNEYIIRQYWFEPVARFDLGDRHCWVVHVPAARNAHMPAGWQPAADFFFVIPTTAISEG